MMDHFSNEKLNDLNSPPVAAKVAKLDSIDENTSKNPEESVNLQSNSRKQLPDKVISLNPLTKTERLPNTHLTESIHETKKTKKLASRKSAASKDSPHGHEIAFFDQNISKSDKHLNINTEKTINSPIKDGHVGNFSLPTLTSDTTNRELDDKLFVFGRPSVNVGTKQFTFSFESTEVRKKSASPDKKQLNEDESLISLLTCINSLNAIISKAGKSKVIGIFDSLESNDTNTIKSALLQLRLAPDKAPWVEKAVFVNHHVPASEFIIRENILFGNKYDAQRYHSAIALSCLREDLKLLADGDKTVVNKKRLQLTDTQKEKLALARAFYANTDIYILEEVLNSIDETTGECIFQTLIRGALEEKVVIFITHNPTYLCQCDEIYVIKNGEIKAQGDHQSLLQTNQYYASMVNTSLDNIINKNVKITMKDEFSSTEKKKAESRALWLNIKILIIFFAIVLSLLYMLQHVSMEQFCSYIMSTITNIVTIFDNE